LLSTSEAFQSKTSFSPLLVIGHTVNDTFSNLLSGLLPVLTAFFDLSYLLAGLVAMVFNLTSSILQPLLGRWFDRTQTTWLLEAGLALNCVGMSLVGISPTYVILLFLVGTAGLGSAAFHPPAFSTVVRSSASGKGGAMGIFLSGGNTGFFLGPIVAGALVSGLGLPGTLVLLPVGLLTAALLLKVRKLGSRNEEPSTETARQPANTRLVTLLATITALRSITIQTAVTFLPLYFVVRGDSLFLATAIASIWLGVGVIGQLGGGFISDRIGRRPVIVTSLLAGALLFYGFLITNGTLSLILLALSGAALYANWSVIVVMSSEAAPSNVGAVSGFMLGFSVGIGGLAALGFGAVADLLGLYSAFLAFAGFALAGGVLALFLPRGSINITQSRLPDYPRKKA
jgi:FSR family fosmidomycin resistance protein-like MFS transporter